MSLVLLRMNEKPTKNYLIVPGEHATTALVTPYSVLMVIK